MIAEYQQLHRRIWPAVAEHLRSQQILEMQIWRLGTRLFMVMDTAAGFSFEGLDHAARANPDVQAWETLMWRFQAPTPWTDPGGKWQPLEHIFLLTDQP